MIEVEGRTIRIGRRSYPFVICGCTPEPNLVGFHGAIPLENGWSVGLLHVVPQDHTDAYIISHHTGEIAGPMLDDVSEADLHLILAEMAMWPSDLGAPSWAKQGGAWRPAPLGGPDDSRRPIINRPQA